MEVDLVKHYKTSDIAKIIRVHPNTVRLYEEWGLLPPVPRNEKGYRLYTEKHLDQMCLARIALRCEFVEGDFRKIATFIVKAAAEGEFRKALQETYLYLALIRSEQKNAIESLDLINQWLAEKKEQASKNIRNKYLKRKDVAKLLDVSIDVLRNWERNGLIDVPRSVKNGYRLYGPKEIERLKIIRTLRNANYSIMAILRMLIYIDRGYRENLHKVIDTPSVQEDIISATDRWISTLAETEKNVLDLIEKIKYMIEKY